MQELPDRELVILARAGDKAAFGELAGRYAEVARRLVLRMAGDMELAHELVQEALLEAYLSLERLREAERFKSWLCGIALNLCRSYLREQKRRGQPRNGRADAGLPELLVLHARPPDPEETAIERELFDLVSAAVQDLSPPQRQATLLYYFEFLNLDEIAALTGISAGAVKVRLHRARVQLRQRLANADPEMAVGKVSSPKPPMGVAGEIQQMRRKTMVRVRIVDVIKRGDKTVVFLMDEGGSRVLPIWIGPFEAASIALGVRGFQCPRPMTFNFIANLLENLDAKLVEARVEALKDETFYGVAKLRQGDRVIEVDARPSDILALAVNTGSPIFVADEVFERAGKAVRDGIELRPDLELEDEAELPPLTGAGIDALVEEFEAVMRWPPVAPPSSAGE